MRVSGDGDGFSPRNGATLAQSRKQAVDDQCWAALGMALQWARTGRPRV